MIKTLRKDLLLIVAVAAVFVSLSYAIGFVTDRSPKTVELPTAFLVEPFPDCCALEDVAILFFSES